MIEIKNPNVEIEKIDLKFLKRKGNKYKSFITRLYGDLSRARRDGNSEMEQYILDLIKDYHNYDSKARAMINSWKGKSGIKIITKPNSFDIIRYRKKDQDSEPKEIIKEVTKGDVNVVLRAIALSNFAENKEMGVKYCETPEIAKNYCKIENIYFNNKENKLFYDNGEFEWQHFFADRGLHTFLNDVLALLDYFQIIHYRAGKIQVLRGVGDIQVVL